MGDDVWFLHHDGEQRGPMSWSELQELAARGEVEPADLLWQPSLPSWEPAGTMDGLRFAPDSGGSPAFSGASGESREQSTIDDAPGYLQPVGAALTSLHRMLPVEALDRVDRVLATVGHIAYSCAAVLAAILLAVLGIRGPSAALIVLAVFAIPIAFVLSYSAARLLTVLRHRLEATTTLLGGSAFLEGLAALVLGTGVAALSVGLAVTLLGAGVVPLVAGAGTFLVLIYTMGVVLDPRALSISDRSEASTGSQALAAVEVLTKLIWLRLLPISYAVAATLGALAVLWLLIGAFGENPPPGLAAVWVCGRVLAVAVIPAAAWLGFQLVWMVLDVVRSLTGDLGGGNIRRGRK